MEYVGFADPMSDRQIEFLKLLDQKGVAVVGHVDGSGHRTRDFVGPALCGYFKDFVLSSTKTA